MFVTDYTKHLLDHVKKIHFIGCGGSGMYPLIQILNAKGYVISGSDVLDGSIIQYEREMGVKVSLGHSADNVIGTDLVVYSAAISKDNVELNAAASYGIPTVERSVLLGYVSRLYKDSICVSGTHGKTTTTSMITTALELAGRDPSAVIGGKLPLIGGYGKAGKGDDIVIEACEYSETFLKLTPYLSVVLNIDNDHLDYYGSMGELKFAFKRFALMTQFMIFANADDKNTMDVMYTPTAASAPLASTTTVTTAPSMCRSTSPASLSSTSRSGARSPATSVWRCPAVTTYTTRWPCAPSAALWA